MKFETYYLCLKVIYANLLFNNILSFYIICTYRFYLLIYHVMILYKKYFKVNNKIAWIYKYHTLISYIKKLYSNINDYRYTNIEKTNN